MTSKRKSQAGATLVMSMIFLILMALFAAAAFKTSSGNMKIVGNMEIREESIAAANKAIEQTISSTLFTTQPTIVAATPITIDIDGNGTTDYTVNMMPSPICYRTKTIKSTQLTTSANDLACLKSSKVDQGGFDVADASSTAGDSLCSNSEWNIGASVTDAATGNLVIANQGVAVRVLVTDAANACPM